ncbi:acyloxyacyl hydrolase [Aquimarina sp. W85]|uniref:acyloxyacyl hydrolase n=1 Tax=Aquimarina rhodophyticola TaxID=3342246 RepID=UPI0036726834
MIRLVILLLGFFNIVGYSQDITSIPIEPIIPNKKSYSIDVSSFQGTILKHNPDISHLITSHPIGVILGINRKTYGDKIWQRLYNYPDYGVSLVYQDLKNPFLGNSIGAFAHYNFYFLKRYLQLRIAQGITYASKPYDIDDNYRNIAYGSHIMSASYFLLNYRYQNIIDKIGLQVGVGILHYSNGNSKAPNKSTNTFFATIAMNYNLSEDTHTYIPKESGLIKGSKPIGFGFMLSGGFNESDLVGSGRYPFLTLGVFASKQLNKKSTVVIGSELFFSKALERYIDYRAVGDFDDTTNGNEDSKRAGAYIGHELLINKLAIILNIGYYFYYPYDFEGTMYNRAGLKYNFTSSIFGAITVRSHAAKAEAIEYSIGYRL